MNKFMLYVLMRRKKLIVTIKVCMPTFWYKKGILNACWISRKDITFEKKICNKIMCAFLLLQFQKNMNLLFHSWNI